MKATAIPMAAPIITCSGEWPTNSFSFSSGRGLFPLFQQNRLYYLRSQRASPSPCGRHRIVHNDKRQNGRDAELKGTGPEMERAGHGQRRDVAEWLLGMPPPPTSRPIRILLLRTA
jgi:hypothetical protein